MCDFHIMSWICVWLSDVCGRGTILQYNYTAVVAALSSYICMLYAYVGARVGVFREPTSFELWNGD